MSTHVHMARRSMRTHHKETRTYLAAGTRYFVGYWIRLLFNLHYLSRRIEVVIAEVVIA